MAQFVMKRQKSNIHKPIAAIFAKRRQYFVTCSCAALFLIRTALWKRLQANTIHAFYSLAVDTNHLKVVIYTFSMCVGEMLQQKNSSFSLFFLTFWVIYPLFPFALHIFLHLHQIEMEKRDHRIYYAKNWLCALHKTALRSANVWLPCQQIQNPNQFSAFLPSIHWQKSIMPMLSKWNSYWIDPNRRDTRANYRPEVFSFYVFQLQQLLWLLLMLVSLSLDQIPCRNRRTENTHRTIKTNVVQVVKLCYLHFWYSWSVMRVFGNQQNDFDSNEIAHFTIKFGKFSLWNNFEMDFFFFFAYYAWNTFSRSINSRISYSWSECACRGSVVCVYIGCFAARACVCVCACAWRVHGNFGVCIASTFSIINVYGGV